MSRATKRKTTDVRVRPNLGLHMDGTHIHIFDNLVGLAHLMAKGWKLVERGENFVVIQEPSSTVMMKARTNIGADLSFIDLVFNQGIYGTGFLGKTVVDAGAYIGDTAVFFAKNGAARVISLEPSDENFQLASENVKQLNHFGDKIVILKEALSDEVGTTNFEAFPDSPNANRIAMGDSDASRDFKKVETTTLEAIMREFGLERINVLKLNCEGGEYAIINSLDEKLASLIDVIYIEFHRGPAEIAAKLERLGYKVDGETRRGVWYGRLEALRKEDTKNN